MSILSRKRRRDIARQRWQFVSVVSTVALGVMMFAASYDAYQNLYISYNGTYDRLKFADAVVAGAADRFATQARSASGVAGVTTRLQADVPLRVGERVFLGRVVGVPTGVQPPINQLDVVTGSYLKTGTTDEVLVETHLAKAYELAPGDSIEMLTAKGWQDLPIQGEVVSAEYLWPAPSSQQLFASSEEFGVLFVPEDLVPLAATTAVQHQALVLYEQGAPTAATDSTIKALADAADAESVTFQADQPSNKALSLDLTGFEQMAWLFPVMFLSAAGLAAYLLLTRVVYSQRDQIGTLRANGLSRSAVLRHYLSYGLWVGLWGAVIGVVLGVAAGWATTGAYTAELGIPDTIRALRVQTPLIGLAFGVIAGLLAAWVPARAGMRVEPAEAMRGEVPTSDGRRSVAERVVPALSDLPVRWLMVLRGFGRNRRRSISTIVGIILALVLLLTSWGLLDTTEILIDRQFNDIQLEDAQLVPTRQVDETLMRKVDQVAGVRRAEQVSILDVAVSGGKGSYSTQLLAFDQDTAMHAFEAPEGGLPAHGVVVGTSIEGKTGVGLDEDLSVRSPSLDKRFTLPVTGVVEEPLGTFAYSSRPELERALRGIGVGDPAALLAQPGYAAVFVQFEPGVDREQVLQDLRDLDAIATATDSRALYNLVQQYLGFFYIFIGMMLVFGGTMALALIFNTVSVNLAERSAELASMRANGMSRRQIASLITAENMILTGIGIIPGLIVGTLAATWFLSTYSSDLFAYNLQIKPSTYVFAAIAMFAVTALSLWPGIRAVGRVDIARVVRERSQ